MNGTTKQALIRTGHSETSVTGYMDRCSDVDPFEQKPCRIAFVQGQSDAAVRSRIIGNRGEAVDEDVLVDLHAPWHGGVVEKTGIVHPRLVGARSKITGRSIATAT